MRANYWFFIPYLLFLSLGIGLLIINDKGTENIFFNTYATSGFDRFFNYYTNVGDGIVLTGMVVCLLFYRLRWAIAGVFALLGNTLIVQAVKRIFPDTFPRPRKFFEGTYIFRDIEGLIVHSWSSFPSGHTAAAFAVFSLLTFINPKKSWGYTFFIAALLVGVSRMYLAQHFLVDVLIGSLVGIVFGAMSYYIFCRKGSFLDKESWADRSLFMLFSKK